MSKKYLIIEYPHVSQMWCGGLGDRIVGLVSAILLARVSGRELQIKWDYPDMSHVWKVGVPFQPQILDSKPSTLIWNTIDKRHEFGKILSEKSLDEVWQEDVVFLQCNQELASFVYENPCYPELKGLFGMHITAVYQNVFAFYFIVKEPCLWKTGKKRVGVQLRTGDTAMKCGDHHIFSQEMVVTKVLPLVQNFFREHNFAVKTHEIFFTSDMDCILQARKAWAPFPLVYQPGPITHLERQSDSEGLEKTVRDLAVLSQSDILIISWHSNLGRVAALMNSMTEVYVLTPDLRLHQIKDKMLLTTKHQQGNQWDAFPESARM
jgi:hypothetical protein